MVWAFSEFFWQKNAETKAIWKNWWYLKNKKKLDHDGTNEIIMVIPSAASLNLSLSRQKAKH